MSILPENIMKRVDTEFKTRQSKAVAMELLTAWRKMPIWKEKEIIGERHGRNVKTVHEISQKLQEMELFTAEQGSIPLFRLELEKQRDSPSDLEDSPESTESTESSKIMTELPVVSPMGVPLKEEPEVPIQPASGVIPDDFGALQSKVFRIESQLGGLEKQLEHIVPVLKGLSARTPENNPANNPSTPNPTPIQQAQPAEQPPVSVPEDPLSGMTKEELLEMMMNQPQQLFSMVRGGREVAPGLRETEVGTTPHTLRKIIVELTTYTMMVYEKSIADGAFEGTLSDFLNAMTEKYFEDRGIALGWHRVDSIHRRRLG